MSRTKKVKLLITIALIIAISIVISTIIGQTVLAAPINADEGALVESIIAGSSSTDAWFELTLDSTGEVIRGFCRDHTTAPVGNRR